jgi:hypothetical protein
MRNPPAHPKPAHWLDAAALLQAGASAIGILLFAYQGSFTRYMSDDYCDAVIFHSGDVFGALVRRYLTISDRFSNILFIGLAEPFGPGGLRFLPGLLMVLWVGGLVWLAGEVRRRLRLRWPFAIDLALGMLLAFVSILGAPNRFQIFYWRSSLSTHFAPIVFLPFLLAFALTQARRAGAGKAAWWVGPAAMLGAFAISGFSEPPAMVLIAGAGLTLAALWFWKRGASAERALAGWILSGALLALLVMFLAPGNSIRLGAPPPSVPVLLARTLLYAFQFMLDTLKVVPLPSLFVFLIPALLFHVHFSPDVESAARPSRRSWSLLLLVPVIVYLLIAASFAPSVYGQSYPVARARFDGFFLQMAGLMVEGALLGSLGSRWMRGIAWDRAAAALALIAVAIAAFYPLRAAWLTYEESAEYRTWAAAWDARDALIRTQAAEGSSDLVVPSLSGIDQIKELDVRPGHWINRCAARYYGVGSISAIPFGPE